MLNNATSEHDCLIVDDVECSSNDISYSVETVNYFNKIYPEHNLRLLMGEDNFQSFTKWHRYEEILNMASIIILGRDNQHSYDNIDLLNNFIEENIFLFNEAKSEKIHFSQKHKSNISSTMVRSSLRDNYPIDDYVCSDNSNYIRARGLYK